ncbi:hypothetical protein DPEC_G00112230 [Dallia pectoralis]|uniref:Uncharacterized protein n=1 Tax=Dallia pectoralis TaxID=75939 RepID=A0ACC2GTY8_DALPE|nr:hypothetical protein DPEC_G00112230 [Dallia pectoralis]
MVVYLTDPDMKRGSCPLDLIEAAAHYPQSRLRSGRPAPWQAEKHRRNVPRARGYTSPGIFRIGQVRRRWEWRSGAWRRWDRWSSESVP